MMLDWAVSLLVVSLIVFGLIAVSVDFFDNMDHDYVLRDGLQAASQTLADQIDRLEGIPAAFSQNFWYNSSLEGVEMPSTIAGSQYTVDFTHDFVVLVSNNSGPPVGAYSTLSEPVYLFPQNMTLQLLGAYGPYPISGYHLHSEFDAYSCSTLPQGYNFQATVGQVTVDGNPTYLTFLYPSVTASSPLFPLHWNGLCT
jgi:hypothetical protein